jgi:tricorn protease
MTIPRTVLTVLFWLALAGAAAAQTQEPIKFARLPDISPDGRQIAFSYHGDIWIVDAAGGVARPITTHEAHDTAPAFSPDGRWIAFSSNRHGGYDVFVVAAHGGKPRRLTFDSGPDMVNGWSPDGRQILFTARRGTDYPPVADLYTVPVTGGREQKISVFEGRDGQFSPRGDQLVYVRGPGTWYRKGYRGSASDEIWIARADGTQNRQLTTFNGQDGSPMWAPDGRSIYYVTEQFGVANICKLPLDGSAAPQPITTHRDDHVRRARISANGQFIVYECGADIWVCSLNGTPSCRKVRIEAYADDKTNPEQTVTYTANISEYALSPDEKHLVIVVHGELFLLPLTGGKARRLTEHPGHDRQPAWAHDLNKILFISDRDGEDNLYVLEHDDPDHPELVRAHRFKTTQLTKSKTPLAGPSFAPDGKTIAFLKDGQLWLMNADGRGERPLVTTTRVIEYDWSPDGKWIVFARMDAQFASELYLVPVTGGPPHNITRYATRNFGLSWSSDGKRLAFISQRRQDLDVFVLSMQKPAQGNVKPAPDIDLDDIHLRVNRVTSLSSDESEAAIKPDGTQVVFRSNALGQDDLWLASVTGGQISRLTTGNVRPQQIRWLKNGMVLFLDGTGALRFVRPGLPGSLSGLGEGQPGRIAFSAKLKINRHEEFVQMFDEGWRKLYHRFYDANLHGVDWAALRIKYRPLVDHVSMHEDFYDLVSLMLGELNASHLGIGGKSRTPEEQTAELGLLWDESHRGPGLKVRDILKRGPADRRGLDLKPGDYVLAINGVELTDRVNVSELLNDKVGETVILEVAASPKAGAQRRKVEIQAASRQVISNLMYQRWVEANAERVRVLSGGRLGYIHLRAMDTDSLDEFVRTLYSDNFDKEAIVLDVRYNGGGFTHDQVLSYLGGKEHTFFIAREGDKGAVLRANDRKWTRPLILLCNNRSYSDAEIFPHAFRSLGLGKLVGLPTGGYVIGTMNERLIDGSLFRVPRLGVFTASGVNMEKIGVQPDYVVDLHPDEVAKGHDAQLVKAVEVLLRDLDEAKKNPSPEPLFVAPRPKAADSVPGGN